MVVVLPTRTRERLFAVCFFSWLLLRRRGTLSHSHVRPGKHTCLPYLLSDKFCRGGMV
jgi:hypothetical protein